MKLFPCLCQCLRIAARILSKPLIIFCLYQFFTYQIAARSDQRNACFDEISEIAQIHTACGNQGYLGEWGPDGFNIFQTAASRGEDFYDIAARIQAV